MTKKQTQALRRILTGAALFLLVSLLPLRGWLRLAAYLVPYAVVGREVLVRAVRNIRAGQVFDENFLMAVATVGAFCCGEYPEGVAVMLFYQVGELFESVAVARSRRSIAELMDIRPDCANVERGGALVRVDPADVAVGDLIVVKPGERIPLDGIVEEGTSSLDTAALTGEALPRDTAAGDCVVSGCVNLTGLLRVRVTKPYGESTVARILALVEESGAKKAKAEHFITKFARYYTPAVVLSALALAVLPPLLGLGGFSLWVRRALIFLVVSCPCALVISVPLSFFGGIGGASRQGILVKGGNYLEALAQTSVVVFDKTGTLTQGQFRVTQVCPAALSPADLLTLAARAERFSDHPLSRSIRAAAQAEELPPPEQAEELAGQGVRAVVDGKTVWVGNRKLMSAAGVPVPEQEERPGTALHVAVDGTYAGCILVGDTVKPTAAQALRALKQAGVSRTVMLSGDAPAAAQAAAQELGIDEVHAGLLPDEKVARLEELLAAKKPGTQLVYVGDGINDAPVLARADVGVAMGALGSDAAIEAADVVLMDDDPAKLAAAVSIARKTMGIVRQNVVFALGVKFLVLGLAVAGRSNLWLAVFADVGVSVLAILNASRMLARSK